MSGTESFRLSNREARNVFIDAHGLTRSRSAKIDVDELEERIHEIGFVQLDTINTVARSHDMILFARAQNFDRATLDTLHRDGKLFEHYTHDASLIPMEFYPYWKRRFAHTKKNMLQRPANQKRLGATPGKTLSMVRKHIKTNGPTMTRDFTDGPKGEGSWWGWSPTKTALEFLYRSGELAVVRREGFHKVYDLASRVIPEDILSHTPSKAEMIDFKCRSALDRIGFGTPAEIGAYWHTVRHGDVSAWAKPLIGKELMEIVVEGAPGEKDKKALAYSSFEDRLAKAAAPSKSLRFISPFDPLIRDRKRQKQLFGFDYTIEIFVPEAKRIYGYYVLPILEGNRIIGRADLKADRKAGILEMKGLWLEPKVALTEQREKAMRRDLSRLAKFCGVEAVDCDKAMTRAAKAS